MGQTQRIGPVNVLNDDGEGLFGIEFAQHIRDCRTLAFVAYRVGHRIVNGIIHHRLRQVEQVIEEDALLRRQQSFCDGRIEC
jgi:hypothetical protein